MSIKGVKDLVNAELEGRVVVYNWRKVPSQTTVQGLWFDLALSPGNPAPKYWFDATPLSSQQAKRSLDGGLNHGGNVSPLQKILRMTDNYTGTATGCPMTMIMCDYLVYYPSCDDSVTDVQVMTNNFYAYSTVTFPTPSDNPYRPNICTHTKPTLSVYTLVHFTTTGTLPTGLSLDTDYYVIKVSDYTCRLATNYANAVSGTYITFLSDGTGIHTMRTILPRNTCGNDTQIMAVTLAARTGGCSFNISYTNNLGVSGRITPNVIQNTSAAIGTITTAGTATSTQSAPFIPLQFGDTGVRSIESVTMLTPDTGLFALILVRPIATTQLRSITAPSEKDYFIDSGLVPIIEDDAFLSYICLPNGSLSGIPIYGDTKFIWN
jgi:hypothetical protein